MSSMCLDSTGNWDHTLYGHLTQSQLTWGTGFFLIVSSSVTLTTDERERKVPAWALDLPRPPGDDLTADCFSLISLRLHRYPGRNVLYPHVTDEEIVGLSDSLMVTQIDSGGDRMQTRKLVCLQTPSSYPQMPLNHCNRHISVAHIQALRTHTA